MSNLTGLCSFTYTVYSSSSSSRVWQPNWSAPKNMFPLYSWTPISFSSCLNHFYFFSTVIHCSWSSFLCAYAFHRFLVSVESALGLCTEQRGFDSWSISTTLLANKKKNNDASLLFSLQKPPFLLERRKRAQIWGIVCQHRYSNHLCQPWHWRSIVWDPDIR